MIDLDIEVGVVRGNVLIFAWKSALSIIRTWWHDGETNEMYIVTYRGQEIIFASTGNSKNARGHAELIVNALNEAKARAYLSSLPDKESPTADGTKEAA